jgi:ankyrin repeat protein
VYRAAGRGNASTIRLLASLGADVNAPTNGWTPLMCAAEGGHVDATSELLKAGADA